MRHDLHWTFTNVLSQPVPWNKMEGKQMQRPLVEDKWTRKIAKENKRRADRAKKLEAVGYEYNAPKLVDAATAIADAAAAKAAAPEAEEQVVEGIEEAVTKAIEAPPAAEAAVVEEAEKETVDTPKPSKRGRGRPPKADGAEATPNKRAKRTKA